MGSSRKRSWVNSASIKSFAPYSKHFTNLNTQHFKRFLGDAANNGMGEILLIND